MIKKYLILLLVILLNGCATFSVVDYETHKPISRLNKNDKKEIIEIIKSENEDFPEPGNVREIAVISENKVEVRTGNQEAPLCGGGYFWTVKKINGKWKITGVGVWES